MTERPGRCLCGAIRYVIDDGAIAWQGYCECESCRRATGAPVVGWIGVRREGMRWEGEEPARHASSPGVIRSFCPRCGTPLTFFCGFRSVCKEFLIVRCVIECVLLSGLFMRLTWRRWPGW